jgi:hypothetical protein
LDSAHQLANALTAVREAVPDAGRGAAQRLAGTWHESRVAGLFLLVPMVNRLGWFSRVQRMSMWQEDGPRLLTYVLAGAALSLLNQPLTLLNADPAVGLFAGWSGEPDAAGFERWLARRSSDDRQELLRGLLDQIDRDALAAESWDTTLERLGQALVRALAATLRGFRRSSDRFIVQRFIESPGRLLVEPRRILVSLRPNAMWVAVHLSGADAPIAYVSWLSGRGVEFDLGGL